MNHQSHRLPRPILCQPCPKHFPPINSHTSHGCSGKSTVTIPVLQMRKPRGRSGSHSFRVMQQGTWDLNPEPTLLATCSAALSRPSSETSILCSALSLHIQSALNPVARISPALISKVMPWFRQRGECLKDLQSCLWSDLSGASICFFSTQKASMAPYYLQNKVQIPLASTYFLPPWTMHPSWTIFLPYLPWHVPTICLSCPVQGKFQFFLRSPAQTSPPP